MDFEYLIAGKTVTVSINKKDNNYEIDLDDEQVLMEPVFSSSNFMSAISNGIFQKVYFASENGITYIFINGRQYRVEDLSRAEQKTVAKDHLLIEEASEICAPMPGKILKILVNEGDAVEVKQNLVIVEAMKMENTINSSINANVIKINFKEGDIVDTGQPIIELEALE